MTHALGWQSVRRLTTAAVLAAVVGSTAGAQDPAQVTVSVRGGLESFDKAASIDNAPVFGLDVMYGVNSWLAIGPVLSLSRANSTGKHFVSAITYGVLNLGDTTYFFEASQPINVLDGAVNARIRMQGRALSPYATGGVGGYVLFLDTQANRGAETKTGVSFNIGAGVTYAMSDRAGLIFDVRNVTFTDYDRTKLDPRNLGRDRIENTLYAEDWPAAPANKKTVNNFVFTVGFSYVPAFFGGLDRSPVTSRFGGGK